MSVQQMAPARPPQNLMKIAGSVQHMYLRNANIFCIFKSLPMQLTMHRSVLCYMHYGAAVPVNISRKSEASVINIAEITSI